MNEYYRRMDARTEMNLIRNGFRMEGGQLQKTVVYDYAHNYHSVELLIADPATGRVRGIPKSKIERVRKMSEAAHREAVADV